jgi:hypothetical protein
MAAMAAFLSGVSILAISMTIGLREVNNPKETAPKYEIMAKTKAGAWVRVGALLSRRRAPR